MLHSFLDSRDKRIAASLGKPWAPRGNGENSFNCWEFVRFVLGDTTLPMVPFQEDLSDRDSVINTFSTLFKEVPNTTPYSIVVMGKYGVMQHVGILHPSKVVYHSLEKSGVIGSHMGHLGIFGFNTIRFYQWEQDAKSNSIS